MQKLLRWLNLEGWRVVIALANGSLKPDEVALVEQHVARCVMLTASGPSILEVPRRFLHFVKRRFYRGWLYRRQDSVEADQREDSATFADLADAMCDGATRQRFIALIAEEKPTAVFAIYALLAGYLDPLPADVLRVVDSVEAFSMPRYDANGVAVRMAVTVSPDEERLAFAKADLVLAIQEDEREFLQRLLPEKRVITVGVDFDIPEQVDEAVRAGRSVGMIAGANAYNIEGLKWFLETCWPRVLEEIPAAMFFIAGAVCDAVTETPAGVVKLGYVSDVADFYRRARIVVNPLLRGTGLKIKTVEALAHGRVVVTLAAGREGIEAPSNGPVKLVESVNEMVAAIVLLLQSDEETTLLGRRARAFAADKFAATAIYRKLQLVLEEHSASTDVATQ